MICPYCRREYREDARFCDNCAATLLTPLQDPNILSYDDLTPSPDFVGRQMELAELKHAPEEALSGQGRLVLLAGEGILSP